MQERIQKFLSRNGVDSRRKCEQYILEGKVKVNGNVVRKLGIKVNPDKDCIEFNGKKIKNNKNELIYILLNKPVGYVTTVKEQFGRKKVLDLIDKIDIIIKVIDKLYFSVINGPKYDDIIIPIKVYIAILPISLLDNFVCLIA